MHSEAMRPSAGSHAQPPPSSQGPYQFVHINGKMYSVQMQPASACGGPTATAGVNSIIHADGNHVSTATLSSQQHVDNSNVIHHHQPPHHQTYGQGVFSSLPPPPLPSATSNAAQPMAAPTSQPYPYAAVDMIYSSSAAPLPQLTNSTSASALQQGGVPIYVEPDRHPGSPQMALYHATATNTATSTPPGLSPATNAIPASSPRSYAPPMPVNATAVSPPAWQAASYLAPLQHPQAAAPFSPQYHAQLTQPAPNPPPPAPNTAATTYYLPPPPQQQQQYSSLQTAAPLASGVPRLCGGEINSRDVMIPQRGTARLFVGQINYDAQEEDLHQIFGAYGRVLQVKIMRNGESLEGSGATTTTPDMQRNSPAANQLAYNSSCASPVAGCTTAGQPAATSSAGTPSQATSPALPPSPPRGKRRCNAFVTYASMCEADNAIAALHDVYVMRRDRPLQVTYCQVTENISQFGYAHAVRLHHENPKNPLPTKRGVPTHR